LPNTLVEARQRIAALGDQVRAEKDASALRAYCLELGDLATTVVTGVDRLAKAAASSSAWPRDLNAPDSAPAWGLDPTGVLRG
jgi:hypothetical protein